MTAETASRPFARLRRTGACAVLALMLLAVCSGTADAAATAVRTVNWAGYALRGPAVDAVVFEFAVPAVTCTADNQALSVWAGFGGITEASLVQAGLQARCFGTTPRYELFTQRTNGTGASTEGPAVSPGDYVRVVACPAPDATTTGRCAQGAPAAANYMTSVAVKRGGTGAYQVWTQSLTPDPWQNTRTEAECVAAERPRDATTNAILDAPRFTMPAVRCAPYRALSPSARADIANGGDGYAAYRLSMAATSGKADTQKADGPGGTPTTPATPTTPTTPPGTPTTGGTSPSGDPNPFDNPQLSTGAAPANSLPIGGGPLVLAP